MTIKSVVARQIFDSRGNPTVEVELTTELGTFVSSCPSGASTGASEAHELRDGGAAYKGKGVSRAVENVNGVLAGAVVGMDECAQAAIDEKMVGLDGTKNKSRLGANAILSVSMAAARAGARKKGVPLYEYIRNLAGSGSGSSSGGGKFRMPMPSFNIINGGEHAGNALAVQEFMVQPAGARSFSEAMRCATEIYHTLRGLLKAEFGMGAVNVGDEGGFAPDIPAAEGERAEERALDIVMRAAREAGYAGKVGIAIDAAASSFYDKARGKYDMRYKEKERGQSELKTSAEMTALYASLKEKYPLVLLEDPLDEEDWAGFAHCTAELCGAGKGKFIVMGDDLLVTNPERIKKAIAQKACNALLLKLNQTGTVSEAVEAARLATEQGWEIMTSHRSGETADDFIADLSVGLRTKMIKSGAPCRIERVTKYNRLLKIEIELKQKGMLEEW